MDTMIVHIINYIYGIFNGIIGTICYNYFYRLHQRKKREKSDKQLRNLHLQKTYSGKQVETITSFGNCHAIQIDPLLNNGRFVFKFVINLLNKPEIATTRNIVMATLT